MFGSLSARFEWHHLSAYYPWGLSCVSSLGRSMAFCTRSTVCQCIAWDACLLKLDLISCARTNLEQTESRHCKLKESQLTNCISVCRVSGSARDCEILTPILSPSSVEIRVALSELCTLTVSVLVGRTCLKDLRSPLLSRQQHETPITSVPKQRRELTDSLTVRIGLPCCTWWDNMLWIRQDMRHNARFQQWCPRHGDELLKERLSLLSGSNNSYRKVSSSDTQF